MNRNLPLKSEPRPLSVVTQWAPGGPCSPKGDPSLVMQNNADRHCSCADPIKDNIKAELHQRDGFLGRSEVGQAANNHYSRYWLMAPKHVTIMFQIVIIS